MKLEPMMKNPILIRIADRKGFIVNKADNSEISLEKGCMFGSEHFGFKIVVETKGEEREIEYGTQRPIDGIGFEPGGENLAIYERNKYVSWKFNKKMNLLQKAKFLEIWRPDREYLETLGIVKDSDIKELNNY